jgi:nucleoside-diphosphate-sugar epimerase
MNQFFNKIYITGHNGYLGSNFIKKFKNFDYELYQRNNKINILDSNFVLHFAGKAHDLSSNWADYESSNISLTKNIFDKFIKSNAKTFIYISSIKAVCDFANNQIDENTYCNPITMYGKSKLISEKYILDNIPSNKKVYILRPSMIYGECNKGNLNLLISLISKVRFWPFANIISNHTFCSINNLFFVINNILNNSIKSGVYNVCDNSSVSLNDLINWIINEKKINILKFSFPVNILKKTLLFMPHSIVLKFKKLMESNLVSNKKITEAIGKTLPVDSIIKTKLN